jgi:hypothetical protein
MQIRDTFQTRIEEKIEPVIKVGDRQDQSKLAAEIGRFVVTPMIGKYLDDFLEHYTDTLRTSTSEIGAWISGYFGSGKSHLGKIATLLVENPVLEGVTAAKRFESRIPSDSDHRSSLIRNLTRVPQCNSRVLAFNLNTLADSKVTPLPRILLSQWYIAKGYGGNLLYARVIESEIDKRGKLNALHEAVSRISGKPWAEIVRNLGFYSKALYQGACEVVPDAFNKPEDVAAALKNAEKGEIFNVKFLVRTILDDLEQQEKASGKPTRMVLLLDESGQWIEDSGERLSQLQALVEEAAEAGRGKIWVMVTTHEDMGSIYQNAKRLEAHGDFKKIEARFRSKWNLTTENIELVLEDCVFRKNVQGKRELETLYKSSPGVIRDLGQLQNTAQVLPECSEDRFIAFYPFFPYQIHLIPEIVKSLRSKGGRGEQLSGSTRTLIAITQDVLRAGRRDYLKSNVRELVSFDEVYGNLASEGEVTPDARRDLSRIEAVVPGAVALTRRVAEVLYLIRELTYIPRTIDNIARLLVENTSDDLPTLINRIRPEIDRLVKAHLVAVAGEEYEFLTGERRTFEEEVANEAATLRRAEIEAGLAEFVNTSVLGFERVPYKDFEFPVRIFFDDQVLTKEGHIEIRIASPLAAVDGLKVSDLEDKSLRQDMQQTVFVLSDRLPAIVDQVRDFIAMRAIVNRWKSDPQRSDEARKLALERESNSLDKLKKKVEQSIRGGLKLSQIIFRGSSHALKFKNGQTPGQSLRDDIARFWPNLYPNYEKVPVRIVNEQRAILDILKGVKDLPQDARDLKLFDKAGQLDPNNPLIDAIRVFLATRQAKKERSLGRDLLTEFTKPPYGWDPNAIRVGVAALVRAGALRVSIDKKVYANPDDGTLQDAIRGSRTFDKVDLLLEETAIDSSALTEVRAVLIRLTGKRKIDEVPAALASEIEGTAKQLADQASRAALWAEVATLPLPAEFRDAKELYDKILSLTNPVHRVRELHACRDRLETSAEVIRRAAAFTDKWGKVFTDMREFAATANSIEYHLPPAGATRKFLENWEAACDNASVIEDQVWKDLQNGKAGAQVELESQKAKWRDTARQVAEKAIENLPGDLQAAGITDAQLQSDLNMQLENFRDSLSNESSITRAPLLPEMARTKVQEIEASIRARKEELARAAAAGSRSGDGSSTKPKRVRLAELGKRRVVASVEQWDTVDTAVRQELAAGNEVEIG